ncbi:MAG TPA: peptidase S10 [Verrucomicrobiae bacterium]|nr:peptidase S10 [Verrucomicrobiae bacterium]
MKRLLLTTLAAALAFCSSGPAARADDPPSPKPSPAAMQPIPAVDEAPDAVTQHTITLDGKVYPYTARAGVITLRDAQGHPTCRMFYTAFTLDGVDSATRPVTFFYNGGPGSSTIWLRMGSFGPKRVVVGDGAATPNAPFQLVDNQYTLLDRTDMVFVDAPGTGFSRIVGAGKPAMFYGVDPDVKAFSEFVNRYVSTFDRWNSPKFLFGESYGTPRSAMLVNALQTDGVGINGVVLLSSVLNFDLDWFDNFSAAAIGGGGADWDFVLYLPTEAAIAWYHHKIPGPQTSLPELLTEVEQFSMNEYLNALAQGSNLSPAVYNDVVAKLHRFTGLSEQFIRTSNLRINYIRFSTELLRDSGQMVGRYDGRYVDYNLDAINQVPNFDATDAGIDAAFVGAGNYLMRNFMKYNTSLVYLPVINVFRQWDWKHNGNLPTNTTADLANALVFNQNLRVFSANGYFDMATPFFGTVYELNHLNLPPDIQSHISYGFYESGHMVYLHPAALAQFHNDLENWYAATLQAGR